MTTLNSEVCDRPESQDLFDSDGDEAIPGTPEPTREDRPPTTPSPLHATQVNDDDAVTVAAGLLVSIAGITPPITNGSSGNRLERVPTPEEEEASKGTASTIVAAEIEESVIRSNAQAMETTDCIASQQPDLKGGEVTSAVNGTVENNLELGDARQNVDTEILQEYTLTTTPIKNLLHAHYSEFMRKPKKRYARTDMGATIAPKHLRFDDDNDDANTTTRNETNEKAIEKKEENGDDEDEEEDELPKVPTAEVASMINTIVMENAIDDNAMTTPLRMTWRERELEYARPESTSAAEMVAINFENSIFKNFNSTKGSEKNCQSASECSSSSENSQKQRENNVAMDPYVDESLDESIATTDNNDPIVVDLINEENDTTIEIDDDEVLPQFDGDTTIDLVTDDDDVAIDPTTDTTPLIIDIAEEATDDRFYISPTDDSSTSESQSEFDPIDLSCQTSHKVRGKQN